MYIYYITLQSDVVIYIIICTICILNSAPMSCDLDTISYKLLTEYLESLFISLTDLFNPSLACGIFPQCFKSAIVTPIVKKRYVDHNDLNNYRPVSNLRLIAMIMEKLFLPKFLSTSTHTIITTLFSQHIVMVTALKQFF